MRAAHPVRIKLDDVSWDLLLVAGRTATASIGKIRCERPKTVPDDFAEG